MSGIRVTTAGESHGPAEVCVVEGIPAGLALTPEHVERELRRRRWGYGRGGRMSIETDACRFVGGVRLGRTIGSPICIMVENADYTKWVEVMSPVEEEGEPRRPPEPESVPRPGHADLAGVAKFGFDGFRSVLERASARETVARVAGGAVCKRVLEELGVTVRGRVISIGRARAREVEDYVDPGAVDWEAVEASPVGCDDSDAATAMRQAIDAARDGGESLGGVVEIWCWGVCPGLGSYASAGARLDGRLLGALGSIPAVKGVEVGSAFVQSERPGSEVHDEFVVRKTGKQRWIARESNHAGGLEGGMTNGMPVVLRAAMKPIPTLTTPLGSVDIRTLEPRPAHVERSDVTAVPAARVVAEAMAARVLASAYVEKFGGDSLAALLSAVGEYVTGLEDRGLWRRPLS